MTSRHYIIIAWTLFWTIIALTILSIWMMNPQIFMTAVVLIFAAVAMVVAGQDSR